MDLDLIAQEVGGDVERVGYDVLPALIGFDALEVSAREHPLVVELAEDRIRLRPRSHGVVSGHPLEKAHSDARSFLRRRLRENALIDDAQERIAGFEGLEKNRPAAGLERALTGGEHARRLQNVVQYRRADDEIGDALAIACVRHIDADQRKAARVGGIAVKKIAQDCQELRADVGRDDARMRKPLCQGNDRISGSRSDIDDQRGICARTDGGERLAEQETPVLDVEIRSMVFLGVLQELCRHADLGSAQRALRRQNAGESRVLRTEVKQRLGEYLAGIHGRSFRQRSSRRTSTYARSRTCRTQS